MIERAAGQPHPFGQADQAGTAAGKTWKSLCCKGIAQLHDQLVIFAAVDQHPYRLSGRVLAGVGQTFLNHPVRSPAGDRRDRFRQSFHEADPLPGQTGLVNQAWDVGDDGLRPLVVPVVVAQHRDDLAQLDEGLPYTGSDNACCLGDLLRRGVRPVLQGAGIGGNKGEPVGQYVVHLAGDPGALGDPSLGDPTALLLLCPAGPGLERLHQLPPCLHHRTPAEDGGVGRNDEDEPPPVGEPVVGAPGTLDRQRSRTGRRDGESNLERAAKRDCQRERGGSRDRRGRERSHRGEDQRRSDRATQQERHQGYCDDGHRDVQGGATVRRLGHQRGEGEQPDASCAPESGAPVDAGLAEFVVHGVEVRTRTRARTPPKVGGG